MRVIKIVNYYYYSALELYTIYKWMNMIYADCSQTNISNTRMIQKAIVNIAMDVQTITMSYTHKIDNFIAIIFIV